MIEFDYFASLVQKSPALSLLGVVVHSVKEGEVELELPYRREICNSLGSVQGGFITAVADAAGGWALITVLGAAYRVPTVEIKMNFLKPVTETMISRGKVVHTTSRLGTAYMEVFLASGQLAAIGTATYRIIKFQR